jgi:hypothetical protein
MVYLLTGGDRVKPDSAWHTVSIPPTPSTSVGLLILA